MTSITAPVMSDARKVMIATTATRALPAIEFLGTIEASLRIGAGSGDGRSGCW